jgi:beta-galactosidase
MRTGRVWYRHRFTLPKDDAANKQPIGLMLGSVDDEAKVWLNGKYCGASGKGFSTPEVFDLTDAITDGENVLAVEIVRNSAANELGTGGIFRPSFIFRGPKIEPTTTQPAEKPLLPGGEVAK